MVQEIIVNGKSLSVTDDTYAQYYMLSGMTAAIMDLNISIGKAGRRKW